MEPDDRNEDEGGLKDIPLVLLSREETTLAALPFFSLDYAGDYAGGRRRRHILSYETKLARHSVDATLHWQVSADPIYGFPDAFDRKVFKVLEYLVLQRGLPLQNPVPFSLHQMLQILGLAPFGSNLARVRSSLRRIAAVTVHSHVTFLKGTETGHLSQTFHLYDDVSFQEESFDHDIGAATHMLRLGAWYLENINQRFVQPVDIVYFRILRNPVASRLYELLTLKFEEVFRRGLKGWRVSYPVLCQLLPFPESGWLSSPQRRLEPAHRDLIATSFVERVGWEKIDRTWFILYVPGSRARNAHTAMLAGPSDQRPQIEAPEAVAALQPATPPPSPRALPPSSGPPAGDHPRFTRQPTSHPGTPTVVSETPSPVLAASSSAGHPSSAPARRFQTGLYQQTHHNGAAAMYLQYWGLTEKPFDNTPNPKFYFDTGQHQEALFKIQYVVNEQMGAALLTGEYGCGKTLIIRTFIHTLNPEQYEIAVLTNPRWKGVEFLREILYQLGRESRTGDKTATLRLLEEMWLKTYQDGRHAVLIIDEAQLINDFETLEELRLLLNFQLDDRFLLTAILVGQPELNAHIDAIPQFEQRLAFRHHLTAMSEVETEDYIQHRLAVAGVTQEIFTPEAVALLYELSGGVPRRINSLCDICLLIGCTRRATAIDEGIVNGAAGARAGQGGEKKEGEMGEQQ